jgi:hypothetical protein
MSAGRQNGETHIGQKSVLVVTVMPSSVSGYLSSLNLRRLLIFSENSAVRNWRAGAAWQRCAMQTYWLRLQIGDMMLTSYPFTEQDSGQALREWGANCGPNALAFALGRNIKDCKDLIPEFSEKRFTNPTMMKAALAAAGVKHRCLTQKAPDTGHYACLDRMFHLEPSVVRIQWEGPWTVVGANAQWAYRHTHWIATQLHCATAFVFDVNCGVMNFQSWDTEIVPQITESIPRATGGWFPTHVYRILEFAASGCDF